MILRQTLSEAVYGFWDGGAKKVFDWCIEPDIEDDNCCKIGSYEANHWFFVAKGKSDKQTLSYAKKHLSKSRISSSFEYVNL